MGRFLGRELQVDRMGLPADSEVLPTLDVMWENRYNVSIGMSGK